MDTTNDIKITPNALGPPPFTPSSIVAKNAIINAITAPVK